MVIEISLVGNILLVVKSFVGYVERDLSDDLIKLEVMEKKLLIGYVEVIEIKLNVPILSIINKKN